MDRTRKRDGRTDGLTNGRTVRLLYASQSSFGGIKNPVNSSAILVSTYFKNIYLQIEYKHLF